MDIGTVIKERRALLGISQQDLSDYSGVGISTVKDLERGVGLVELSRGNYEFTYDDAFRADGSTPPVSVNLPKSQKVYHSERIFPVFTNMLPEGANRRALCRERKVDENDFFGMLEMICGMDAIGKFVLKRPEK